MQHYSSKNSKTSVTCTTVLNANNVEEMCGKCVSSTGKDFK